MFYSNLEALAFEETETEYEDTTLPDPVYQDGKIDQFVEALVEQFGVVSL